MAKSVIKKRFPNQAIDSVVHIIRLNWKTSSVINGLKREEITFPQGIFREFVVNALVHRDYSIRGKTRIKMSPGRIDITSPGRLVNTVTVDKMKWVSPSATTQRGKSYFLSGSLKAWDPKVVF